MNGAADKVAIVSGPAFVFASSTCPIQLFWPFVRMLKMPEEKRRGVGRTSRIV
jgi:hypothetical protein